MTATKAPVERPVHLMSVDVEEWYHLNYSSMRDCRVDRSHSRVCANMEVLLEAFAEKQVHATFFFLGSVAERFPDLVRRTHGLGHEIASHGYGHELVYQQTRAEFAEDVGRSVAILQDITGEPVRGYRAPCWSISAATPWAYEVLVELGFDYCSSLFPYTTYLYGDGRAPVAPFVRNVGGQPLIEVPASVVEVGSRRIPFGGGFYFRALPYWITRAAARLVHRSGRPAVFYLHPREIDPDQPRLPLPTVDRLVSYVNLRSTLAKLRRLLAEVPVGSIRDYLDGVGPRLPVLSLPLAA